MRVPPTERRRLSKPKIAAIVALVALVIGIFSLRALALVYTDFLWFDELGFETTWRNLFWAKALPALVFTGVFFLFLLGNLEIADRLAPRLSVRDLKRSGEEDLVLRYRRVVGPYLRRIRILVSLVFALIAGFGVWSRWHDWILFLNRQDFGIEDPQFGRDVGFYVFELPFYKFAFEWVFASLIIVIIVTTVAHYFNGGIRLQGAAPRVTPQVKVHISVLLALVAIVRAWGYWLERYELALSTRGAVHGAGYTDLEARLPALHLLIVISLAAVVLFLVNIRLKGWALPIIAVGLWAFVSLAIGTVYPNIVQRFRVEPNEFAREEELIERNIEFTRRSFGLDTVVEVPYAYEAGGLEPAEVEANREQLDDARLWDPDVVRQTYDPQELTAYYRFTDVDVDRYLIDGELTQTVLAARELSPDELPSRSWVSQRLFYTHGFGLVMSPADEVDAEGGPEYLIRDIPPTEAPDVPLDQPRLYYGESVGGYAIVDTETSEFDYPAGVEESEQGASVTTQYDGEGGIPLSNFVRRAAFALSLWDHRPLISDEITGSSRVLVSRDIADRVQDAAPFLEFDGDPYPVAVDGRTVWIVDAYTVTDNYPFAQAIVPDDLPTGSGLNRRLNYVRNSIKAVVDAYDGTVTFYVVDESDPMARAYRRAFPDLFTSLSEVPADLAAHFRHPEDMFRIQASVYRSYHTIDPEQFFTKNDQWQLARDPQTGQIGTPGAVSVPTTTPQTAGGRDLVEGADEDNPMAPLYLLTRLAGETTDEFVLVQPFVPVGGNQRLESLLVARNDGPNRGELVVYTMPGGPSVDGPAIVDSRILTTEVISARITLLNQQRSAVIQGSLQPYLVSDSLVYVRPMYLRAEGGDALPQLAFVVAVNENVVVVGDNLDDALDNLAEALADEPAAPPPDGTGGTSPDGPAEPDDSTNTTPDGQSPPTDPAQITDEAELLRLAIEASEAAERALEQDDLGEYQEQNELVRSYLARIEELQAAATTTTTAPPA